MIVYKNYDNDFEINLFEQNKRLGKEDIESITEVELRFNNNKYSSKDFPDAFNFISEKDNGSILVRLGRIPFDTSEKKKGNIDVVVFFTSHPNGVKFFEFKAAFDG